MADVVTALAGAGKKRETIKKSVTYLAAVLDDAGVDPNPARSKKVRLPHQDCNPEAPLFAGEAEARLRMVIIRACKAAGVPRFTPHDLRHRRVSPLHRQGRTWAETGRLVGQKKLGETTENYTHVLAHGREADYEALVA